MKQNMDKAMRLKLIISALLFLLLSLDAGQSLARSPWQWNLALKQTKIRDAMVMPTALFIDREKGHYYVVDSGKNRLLSFDRTGKLLHILTAGKALDIPFDMVRTGDGGLWVVEKGKNSLSYIDLKARKVTPHTLYYNGELIFPDRIEYVQGILYVLDKASGDIISYDMSLRPIGRFSCGKCPGGFVDFKLYGNSIWALDLLQKMIYVFDPKGDINKTIPLGKEVSFPVSVAVGPSGYIYILDRHQGTVAVYDRNGGFKYHFLSAGIAQGQLYFPIEIRFDPWGRLCVVDEGNGRVEVFSR